MKNKSLLIRKECIILLRDRQNREINKEIRVQTDQEFEQNEINPTGIYLLKVNNRNTRTRCEICSKLTIKTPERRQCFYS